MAETFLPFGVGDHARVIDTLHAERVDALLISMVGQDAVDFNRAFGRAGLHRRTLRLWCAIEENQLLDIGADNTDDLYVALGNFSALQTEADLVFKERYHGRFGDRAPVLKTIGQSLYEGMHFLAALLADGRSGPVCRPVSARYGDSCAIGRDQAPMYLALADGLALRAITRI